MIQARVSDETIRIEILNVENFQVCLIRDFRSFDKQAKLVELEEIATGFSLRSR
jgi:hypothetical protein